jgi:hypothetical protein
MTSSLRGGLPRVLILLLQDLTGVPVIFRIGVAHILIKLEKISSRVDNIWLIYVPNLQVLIKIS